MWGVVFVLPGQNFDQETGKHCKYFRDYDSAIGRYIESDSIGLKGGLNTYLYVHTDRRGLDAYGDWPPSPSYDFLPNRNLTPGFTPQDGICTLPGPIGAGANSNRCILKCCQVHNDCFTQRGCTSSSWAGNAMFLGLDSQRCNSAAAHCIAKAMSKGCPAFE